jgi:hypothetical protein
MDPRRKKIYIILIITCFAISAGILGWTFFSNPTVEPSQNPNIIVGSPQSLARPATGSVSEGFQAPSVFPTSPEFNTKVLESESFTKLKPYSKVDVTGQLGREDPFKNF